MVTIRLLYYQAEGLMKAMKMYKYQLQSLQRRANRHPGTWKKKEIDEQLNCINECLNQIARSPITKP